MSMWHLDPSDRVSSPAFSEGTAIEGATRLVMVGGQNGTDADGRISGDLAAQTVQALRNVLSVLALGAATADDVLKLTVYLTADADPSTAFRAASEVWGSRRTAVTVLKVAGFARHEALVEIEAFAAVHTPERKATS
ncbi:RidA family protein [Nocardia brevicatena]|uniref:RidA family protein n=1 Tax=Nocardia brevicatena TaxID=37327 RepID=UPI000687F876|nr:RidA family protein [Nocardia brevicatena]